MNLAATMSLDNRGFVNPLAGAQNAVSTATNGMRSAFAGVSRMLALVGVSFAAFKSAEGFAESVKAVAATGKELKGLSEATGTSVKDLVILRKAFDDVGIGADSIQQNLVMMQKALGGVNEQGEPTKHIFEQIGLNIETLKNMDTVKQLDAITAAIAKLPNQAARAAAATGIFGRAGAGMLKLVANPEAIKEAGAAVGGQAVIYQRSAKTFAEITNTLDSLSKRVKGFFLGFTDGISPVLLPLLQRLKKSMDFTGVGEKVGKVVAIYLQAFKTGDIGELLSLSLQIGAVKFLNMLSGGLVAAFSVVNTILGDKNVIGGLRDGLISAAQAMGAVLLDVFQDAFIGAGGPALDYARRTAAAVEKMAAQKSNYDGPHKYLPGVVLAWT